MADCLQERPRYHGPGATACMLSSAGRWGRRLSEAIQDSLASTAPGVPEMQRERLNPQAANLQVVIHKPLLGSVEETAPPCMPCIHFLGCMQDMPAVSKKAEEVARIVEKPVRRLMTSMVGHSRGKDPDGRSVSEKAVGSAPTELGAQPAIANSDATQGGADLFKHAGLCFIVGSCNI